MFGDFLLFTMETLSVYLCTSNLLPWPPAPEQGGGDSLANVLCFYFCIVPMVQEKCRGFDIPRQIWQCNVIADCGEGGTAMVLPAVPTVWRFLEENCRQKFSPCCSPVLGEPWLQMTSA